MRHWAKEKRVNQKKYRLEMVSDTHRRCAAGPSQGEVDISLRIFGPSERERLRRNDTCESKDDSESTKQRRRGGQ